MQINCQWSMAAPIPLMAGSLLLDDSHDRCGHILTKDMFPFQRTSSPVCRISTPPHVRNVASLRLASKPGRVPAALCPLPTCRGETARQERGSSDFGVCCLCVWLFSLVFFFNLGKSLFVLSLSIQSIHNMFVQGLLLEHCWNCLTFKHPVS